MRDRADMRSWVHAEWRRVRLSVELLTERRALAIIVVDLLILLQTLVVALVNNGEPSAIYSMVVLLPFVLLGVPVLANAVTLERRSGSLDLLLASPSSHDILVRRLGSFCVLMLLQGWIVLVLAWLLTRPFPLPFVLIQTVCVCALLGAVLMFWSLYLRSTAAVIVAALVTLLVLSPWFLSVPIPPPNTGAGRFLMPLDQLLPWMKNNLILGLSAVVFYLYARRRLTRSEPLLR